MNAQQGSATSAAFRSTRNPPIVNGETMKPSLNFLPASKLAEMIRTGETTSRQAVDGDHRHDAATRHACRWTTVGPRS
jgi:hypothetical protein